METSAQTENEMTKTVGIYPPIKDETDQADLLARLTWHLWPWRGQIAHIRIWSPTPPHELSAAQHGFDPVIDSQYSELKDLLRVTPPCVDEDAMQDLVREPVRLLYVWRAPRSGHERRNLSDLRRRTEAAGGFVHLVDKHQALFETSSFLWGCYNAFGNEDADVAENRQKFLKLIGRTRRPRVYILSGRIATSLSPRATNLSDGDALFCGSMLLPCLKAGIKPTAIAASDATLHAGCSRYAGEFRAALRQSLEYNDVVLFTPMRDYLQHVAQLPAHLHEKVIGLPLAADKQDVRLDLESEFLVSPGEDDLTTLSLPVAASLYDQITICALEEHQHGRPGPHDAASIPEELENVRQVHPAYFEGRGEDSETIATDLERLISAIEAQGKSVVSLSPSKIPALAARHARRHPPRKTPSGAPLTARLIAFSSVQLRRSRRVQALLAAFAGMLALSLVGWSPVDTIKWHLLTLSFAALGGTAAVILSRFVSEYRADVIKPIAARSEALADAAVVANEVLNARGAAKRLVAAFAILAAIAWLASYALHLTGTAPRLAIEIAFWGGGLALLGFGALVFGVQILAHTAKRVRARSLQHASAEARARWSEALAPLHEELRTASALAEDLARRVSAHEIMGRNLEAALGRVHEGVAQIAQLTDAVRTEATASGEALTEELHAVEQRLADFKLNLDVVARDQASLAARLEESLVEVNRSISEAGAAIADEIRGAVQRLADGARALDERTAAIETTSKATTAKVAETISRAERIETKLASLNDDQKKLAEAVAQASAVPAPTIQRLEAQLTKLKEEMQAVSTGGFQSFSRHLTRQELQALASELSRTLKISVTGHSLGYMAMQIRELEKRLRGRFATQISDLLVRTACLLALDRREAAVLEIGTLFGIGAAAMHRIARPRFDTLTMTLIDPLDGYYGRDYLPDTSDLITGVPVTRDTLESNLSAAGIAEGEAQIIQELSQSADAIAAASQRGYDLLIIDGDHSYEGARRDYVNYAHLVRQNGFIIFDDYSAADWQGVTDCANDVLARETNLERVLLNGRTLVCRVTGDLLLSPSKKGEEPPEQASVALRN